MTIKKLLQGFIASLAFLLYLSPWYVIFRSLSGTPLGIDFGMLRFAAASAMHLQNPYTAGPGFYNPPWMLLITAPFAIIPEHAAYVFWTALGIVCYVLAFRQMGIRWPAVVILVFSPLVVGNLMFGNYDWMILVGATLPPAVGIWLVALKPQIGAVLALLWMWWAARKGLRSLAILVLPVTAAILISLLLGYRLPDSEAMRWSADIWPWGIPIGVALAYYAFRRSDPLLALAAAPFLSPYIVWHSWIAVLLPLTRNRWTLAAGILGSWVLFWWVFTR